MTSLDPQHEPRGELREAQNCRPHPGPPGRFVCGLTFGRRCSSESRAVPDLVRLGRSGAHSLPESWLRCFQFEDTAFVASVVSRMSLSGCVALTCGKMVVAWVPVLTVSLQEEELFKYLFCGFASV